MRLLQGDRRVNVDLVEANNQTYKIKVKRLREEVRVLRSQLGRQLRIGIADGGAGMSTFDVTKIRKQYDAVKQQRSSRLCALEKLKDGIRDLELEVKPSASQKAPTARKIRMLENRLDKALIKYNEAQSIKKTYEQIVERLREERVGFDHQLAALERTFTGKRRDYEELLLLSSDAHHAREVAQVELEHVCEGYNGERRRRDDELRKRHQMVQIRRQTTERSSKREKLRREVTGFREDSDARVKIGSATIQWADADTLMSSSHDAVVAATEIMSSSTVSLFLSKERIEQRSKIDVFERAFRKIKDTTGVSDVNEVIQRIFSQEGTLANLMALANEQQLRVDTLHDQQGHVEAHLDDVKYSNGGGGGCSRKLVDDHEEQLAIATAQLDRARAKCERLAKILVAARAGVKHLQDKLEGVRPDVGKNVDGTNENLIRTMTQNEDVTIDLLTRIDLTDEVTTFGPILAQHGDDTSICNEPELVPSRPHNQRIELPAIDECDRPGDSGLYDSGDIDEECSRAKVKEVSTQIILSQEKLKRRPHKERGN